MTSKHRGLREKIKPISDFGVKRIKQLCCKHKNTEVLCWHWTHGMTGNEIRFLEIQEKCLDCGKGFLKYMRDWGECEKFALSHPDKRW